jgi:type II secretion system protein I
MRCSSSNPRRRAAARRGLTLLEVIISTAIFLLALVALIRLVDLGNERARDIREETEGLQKAQAKLASVLIGDIPVSTAANGGYDQDEDPSGSWTWSLTTEAGNVPNLYNVQITVQRQHSDGSATTVTLSQMVLDPQYRGTTVPTTSSGSSSSSSSSSSTTGGN